jgi:hypothetical protein
VVTISTTLTFNHSGNNMYRLPNIQALHIIPTQCSLCFMWCTHFKAVLSLNRTNLLIFVIETQFVFWGVEIEVFCLYIDYYCTRNVWSSVPRLWMCSFTCIHTPTCDIIYGCKGWFCELCYTDVLHFVVCGDISGHTGPCAVGGPIANC